MSDQIGRKQSHLNSPLNMSPGFQKLVGVFMVVAAFTVLMLTTYAAFGASSSDGAQTFTLDGKLYQAGTTSPLRDPAAKLNVQIIDPTGRCVLYEEEQLVNTMSSEGYFHINVGSNTGAGKRTVNDPGRSMAQIFQNISGINANNTTGQICPAGVYTPAAGAVRYFRLTVTPSTTNVSDVLTPDLVIDSVPQAIVAQSVQGLERDGILQANVSGSTILNQANLEALFTTPAYTNLQSILAGNFLKIDTSGVALPSYPADPAGATAGDIWFDSTTGQIKYQTGSGVQVVGGGGGGSSGGISSLTVGSSISLNGVTAGTISSGAGTIDLTDTGVGAGTYSKVTVDTKGRVTAGTVSLSEADIPNLTVAGKVSGNTITSGTISGSAAINSSGNIITTGTVSGLTVQATNLRVYNGSNYIQMSAPALSGNVNLTLPADDGNAGEVLSTNGSGVLSWMASLTNSLTSGKIWVGNGSNVATAVDLSGDATINNTGVLTLANTGVGAGTYTKVTVDTKGRVTSAANITSSDVTTALGYTPSNASALAGDVSGSFAATSVDKIKGKAVSAATADGQIMIYNGTAWTNAVVSGDASLANTGTLTLNTVSVAKGGTGATSFAANRIIASNGTGSALQAFTCALGQVISFDASGNATCGNASTGTVTSVTSSNAYLTVATGTSTPVLTINVGTAANTVAAGDDSRITDAAQKSANLSDLTNASTARTNLGLGTAAVYSVGSAANNIVQLDGSSKLPAVDGSALTGLNPANLSSVVPVAKGGTGASSLSANGLLVMNGLGTAQQSVALTNGQVLIGATGSAPVAANLSAGSGISITNGGGSIVISSTISSVGGSGTTGYLPKFSGATTLADSPVAISGTSVGIGISTPAATLEVAGGVKLGNDLGTCNAAKGGTMKYVSNNLLLCNGTAWKQVSLTDPAANVVLVNGSGSGMNVTGPGSPAYGTPVVFTFQNTGTANTAPISTSLSSTANFSITADSCNGVTLTPSSSCTVTVRPFSSANEALSANLILNW